MKPEQLEALIREHLNDIVHMSLGTSRDNKPWVCEVHFAFDDDLNIYWRSLTSRRHSQEIADNPCVAANTVRQVALGEKPLGIYFEGTAEQLSAVTEQDAAYLAISQRLGVGPEILEDAQNPEGHQFYKLTVSSFYLFANLDGTGGKKHELIWKK